MTKAGSDETRPERLHQSIARTIGTAILSGQHPPGSHFEGEIEGAEALGVSRTPYREAIRILVAKGLLETRPKAGTHVTQRHRWNLLDPDVLGWMFTGTPDETFIRDLFELRGVIEPAGAALAAQRRTDDQLSGMALALDDMGRHGLATEDGQAADRQFHQLVLEATANTAFISLASSIGAAVKWTTHFKQKARPSPRDPLPEHRALYTAIAAQDTTQARAAMQHLLTLALEDMRAPE